MRTDPSLRFSSGYEPGGLNLPGRHFQDGVSQSGSERNHLFLASHGAFVDVAGVSGADSVADGRAVALLDFDRDGWRDIALVNANAPLFELYRNEMGAVVGEDNGRFIALRFIGGNRQATPSSMSNRDGYGAVVEAKVGTVSLVREHRAGEGLAAQNSAAMLIGIGVAPSVSELRVRWPSGRETRLENIPAGTLVTADEESGRFDQQPYSGASHRANAAAIDLDRSIDRGLGYFATKVRKADPSWISLFGYMRRRFGIEVPLASGQLAHSVRQGVDRSEMFDVYRRIDDPSAAIDKQTIADLPHVVDRITASALHCDRIDLPGEWTQILAKASRAGGYALTHAVLAARWTVENGCVEERGIEALRGEQVRLLVELINNREELAQRFDSSLDLWIEAVAMAYYAGAKDAVPADVVGEIVGQQRADGGWPHEVGKKSNPHTSALALWVLLENSRTPIQVPWLSPNPDSQRTTDPAP